MPFTTYAELKTAVAKWLERTGDTDLSNSADDVVTLAEARLNRELNILRIVQTSSTPTGSIGSRQLSLPSDFHTPIALFLTTYGEQTKLRKIVIGGDGLRTSNGVPEAWGLAGAYIELDCPCDAAHTFLFQYKKFLGLASEVNWLFQKYPDVYLQASLAQGALLFGDADAFTGYDTLLERSLGEIRRIEAAAIGMAPLQIAPEFTLGGGERFNINTGQ